MNTKYMFIVAAMAIMLIGATALSSEDAFADGKKKHYEKSQAVAQVNDCGNGVEAENVACSNSASQIQGEENSAALASEQSFSGEVEVVPVSVP